jgi:hypothetical protein
VCAARRQAAGAESAGASGGAGDSSSSSSSSGVLGPGDPQALRLVGPPRLADLVATMLWGAGLAPRLHLPLYVTELVESDRCVCVCACVRVCARVCVCVCVCVQGCRQQARTRV